DVLGRVQWGLWLGTVEPGPIKVPDLVHNILYSLQGILTILCLVVRHPTDLTVGGGPAQTFIVNALTYGSLYQIAPGQKDAPRLVHDQGLIAHDGQIGPTGHTAAHDRCDLGNPHTAHHGIVPEDPAKV